MKNHMGMLRLAFLALLLAAQALVQVRAEPYLAVREGLGCPSCHVNPTGGGLRTTFGDVFAQTQWPAEHVDVPGQGPWLGNVGDFLRVGGDLRGDFSWNDTQHTKKADSFSLDEVAVYGEADVIKNRLTLYVDELLAPGGATTREAYPLLWLFQHQAYLKAGRFYLPYGLRLQDDYAFIRQVTGVNYETPDDGVELGYLQGPWSAQLAVTNGNSSAGSSNSQGKDVTGSVVYVQPGWRLGASFSDNGANGGTHGERRMGGVFAGVRTGPLAWLAEADYIVDRTQQPNVKEYVGLLEANWAFLRGHNLKLTAEYYDPNVDVQHNQQNRFSVVWEYTPMQFLQTRLGVRRLDGIPQNNAQNATEGFVELHGFF
jgi:hypothetical protein